MAETEEAVARIEEVVAMKDIVTAIRGGREVETVVINLGEIGSMVLPVDTGACLLYVSITPYNIYCSCLVCTSGYYVDLNHSLLVLVKYKGYISDTFILYI